MLRKILTVVVAAPLVVASILSYAVAFILIPVSVEFSGIEPTAKDMADKRMFIMYGIGLSALAFGLVVWGFKIKLLNSRLSSMFRKK